MNTRCQIASRVAVLTLVIVLTSAGCSAGNSKDPGVGSEASRTGSAGAQATRDDDLGTGETKAHGGGPQAGASGDVQVAEGERLDGRLDSDKALTWSEARVWWVHGPVLRPTGLDESQWTSAVFAYPYGRHRSAREDMSHLIMEFGRLPDRAGKVPTSDLLARGGLKLHAQYQEKYDASGALTPDERRKVGPYEISFHTVELSDQRGVRINARFADWTVQSKVSSKGMLVWRLESEASHYSNDDLAGVIERLETVL